MRIKTSIITRINMQKMQPTQESVPQAWTDWYNKVLNAEESERIEIFNSFLIKRRTQKGSYTIIIKTNQVPELCILLICDLVIKFPEIYRNNNTEHLSYCNVFPQYLPSYIKSLPNEQEQWFDILEKLLPEKNFTNFCELLDKFTEAEQISFFKKISNQLTPKSLNWLLYFLNKRLNIFLALLENSVTQQLLVDEPYGIEECAIDSICSERFDDLIKIFSSLSDNTKMKLLLRSRLLENIVNLKPKKKTDFAKIIVSIFPNECKLNLEIVSNELKIKKPNTLIADTAIKLICCNHPDEEIAFFEYLLEKASDSLIFKLCNTNLDENSSRSNEALVVEWCRRQRLKSVLEPMSLFIKAAQLGNEKALIVAMCEFGRLENDDNIDWKNLVESFFKIEGLDKHLINLYPGEVVNWFQDHLSKNSKRLITPRLYEESIRRLIYFGIKYDIKPIKYFLPLLSIKDCSPFSFPKKILPKIAEAIPELDAESLTLLKKAIFDSTCALGRSIKDFDFNYGVYLSRQIQIKQEKLFDESMKIKTVGDFKMRCSQYNVLKSFPYNFTALILLDNLKVIPLKEIGICIFNIDFFGKSPKIDLSKLFAETEKLRTLLLNKSEDKKIIAVLLVNKKAYVNCFLEIFKIVYEYDEKKAQALLNLAFNFDTFIGKAVQYKEGVINSSYGTDTKAYLAIAEGYVKKFGVEALSSIISQDVFNAILKRLEPMLGASFMISMDKYDPNDFSWNTFYCFKSKKENLVSLNKSYESQNSTMNNSQSSNDNSHYIDKKNEITINNNNDPMKQNFVNTNLQAIAITNSAKEFEKEIEDLSNSEVIPEKEPIKYFDFFAAPPDEDNVEVEHNDLPKIFLEEKPVKKSRSGFFNNPNNYSYEDFQNEFPCVIKSNLGKK